MGILGSVVYTPSLLQHALHALKMEVVHDSCYVQCCLVQ